MDLRCGGVARRSKLSEDGLVGSDTDPVRFTLPELLLFNLEVEQKRHEKKDFVAIIAFIVFLRNT